MQGVEPASSVAVARPKVVVRPIEALAWHWPVLIAIGMTFVLGVPTLLYPYGPDQALFAYMGEHIRHGARLYVDVWDVKPPGIFWLYALITALPGPEFKVLRAFDLLWTGATVAAVYALGTVYWSRIAGTVAAALYGATYITATGYWHTAQPDSFMILPMILALLAFEAGRRSGSGWSVAASGVLFGLCVQFRPMIVFVPGALVLVDLVMSWRAERADAVRRALLVMVGGFAVEAVTLLSLALQGALGEFLYAQLIFAGNYGRQGGPYSPDGLTPGSYLSGLRTGTMFIIFARFLVAVPALFAAVAGGLIVRDRRVIEVTAMAAAAWLGVAVQGKFFLYHWHGLMPFLALLTGWSAWFVWQKIRAAGRPRWVAAFTVTAIGALLLLLTPSVTDRAENEWWWFLRYLREPASRAAFLDRFGLYGRGTFSFRASDEVAAYIRQRTNPDDTIFLWGYDPLLYVLSERDSASRFTSFLPLMTSWTPHEWHEEFVNDLERRKPSYILLQRNENARWITGNSIDPPDFVQLIPRFQQLLERDYQLERYIEDYTLFRRKE